MLLKKSIQTDISSYEINTFRKITGSDHDEYWYLYIHQYCFLMFRQLKYEKGKSRKLKLIALCIKAVTGVLGASMILTEQRPYVTLTILCIGAVANEVCNFINEEETFPTDRNAPQQ